MLSITDKTNMEQISEYDVFRFAYRAWYGSDNPDYVESDFGQWLNTGDLPGYVKHYLNGSEFEA